MILEKKVYSIKEENLKVIKRLMKISSSIKTDIKILINKKINKVHKVIETKT